MSAPPVIQTGNFANGWWLVKIDPQTGTITAVRYHGKNKPKDAKVPEGHDIRYSFLGFWWKMPPSYGTLVLYGSKR